MSFFSSIWKFIKNLFGGNNPSPTPIDAKRTFFGFQFLAKDQWSCCDSTLQFFSNHACWTDSRRNYVTDWCVGNGYNAIAAFNFNPQVRSEGIVTMFKGGNNMVLEVDQAQLDLRKKWLDIWADKGITWINLSYCCEKDGPHIAMGRKIMDNMDKFSSLSLPPFEKYYPLVCTALEAEKLWDGASIEKLGQTMKKYTISPMGVHGSHIEYLSGASEKYKIEFIKNYGNNKTGDKIDVDPFFGWELIKKEFAKFVSRTGGAITWQGYEWGGSPESWNGISPAQMYSDCGRLLANVRRWPSKRILFFESNLGRTNSICKLQGLAQAFNDTERVIGVGSGCPKGLNELMLQLPRGMNSTIVGNIITLIGQGITCIANLSNGTFSKK